MKIFSFHLVETTPATTIQALYWPPRKDVQPGLCHAECMSAMTLGSPILSCERLQLKKLAMFALWEDEASLETFLSESSFGRRLASGWHVRLEFLRKWGQFSAFEDLPDADRPTKPEDPIVAVTLARLKLPELFRFIRWGRPVEELVRDHPKATLALAAMRHPRTFNTFSVWRSLRDMSEMVHGKNACPAASQHADAMLERERRDFHHEFVTFRFHALSEHGKWLGRGDYIPTNEELPGRTN